MNDVGTVSVSTVVLAKAGKWSIMGILGSKVWCTVYNAFSPNCIHAQFLICALDSDTLFLNLSLACWSLSRG